MYLFVFMYLFIYLHHDHYGNCNSELCWSAKEKGGEEDIITRMRDNMEDRKMDCSGRRLYRILAKRWHLGHIKMTFWKMFVFIFYDHFCKITNSRHQWKVEASRKRQQMEWKDCRRKELPVQSERLRLTYFCCILVIYKEVFGGHKLRTIVC